MAEQDLPRSGFLDRSAVYERDAPGSQVRTSHTWLRENVPPFPKKYDPEKLLRETTQWVLAGNRVVFIRTRSLSIWRISRNSCVDTAPRHPRCSRCGLAVELSEALVSEGFALHVAGVPSSWSSSRWLREFSEPRSKGSKRRRQPAWFARSLALAQRRSMMGELVASLTHELNQPLGAVLSNLGGLARLVSQGNPDPALATRAVNNAIEDAKRAGEIVRRVRALFKGNGAKKTSIDIGALVSEVVALLASEAALRKIRIEIPARQSSLTVYGDRILLQQCVLNLLMNAFDATAKVETANRKVTIEIAPEKPGWIDVAVIDRGPGIDPSVKERLFEPFVTTKSHGMGLGLLVTRSIIEDHGGRIAVKASAQGGTAFTLTLPTVGRKLPRASRGASRSSAALTNEQRAYSLPRRREQASAADDSKADSVEAIASLGRRARAIRWRG